MIDDDLDMYHEESDTPARARTTTLNEGMWRLDACRVSSTWEAEKLKVFLIVSSNGIG